MRRVTSLVVLAVAACGPSPSAKQAAPTVGQPRSPEKHEVEAFAVAAVDAQVDVVADRKGLALENGGSLVPWRYKAQLFPGPGAAPVFQWRTAWRLVGSDRPDISLKDVSAPVPEGAEIVWRWNQGERAWESVVVRTPPILTTRDVSSADIATERSVSIAMNGDRTSRKDAVVPTLEIAFTEEGSRRLAAWAKASFRRPIAYLVRGVVVHEWFVSEDENGIPMAGSVTLSSLGPGTTEGDLRALAGLLNERRSAR